MTAQTMTTHTERARVRYIAGAPARIGVLVFAIAIVAVPLLVADRFWLAVIATAGVYALGAIGLNVLSGYLGEPSLGQAFFLAVGCYAGLAAGTLIELPLLLWLAAVIVAGSLIGVIVAPLSMRLSGAHFIIVSLGLVYIGVWAFTNLRVVSGGPGGKSFALPLSIGGLDFNNLSIGPIAFTSGQGLALLIWIVVGLCLVWVYNVANSRIGREMKAIRDNVLAAQVAGVNLWRRRLVAFVMCGTMAALAGAFYGQSVRYVEPGAFDLMMSIEIVAMLIIGGSATTFGPIIGAVFVALIPALLDRYLGDLPFVLGPTETGFGMTVPQLSGTIFALLLVFFLIREPRGIAKLIEQLASRISTTRKRNSPISPTATHEGE